MYVNYVVPEPKTLFDVSVTISMLINTQSIDENYFLDNCSIKTVLLLRSQVIIIGRLVNILKVNDQTHMLINDNTGFIKVILFKVSPVTNFLFLYF